MTTDRRNNQSKQVEHPIFNVKLFFTIIVTLFIVNNLRLNERQEIRSQQLPLIGSQTDSYTTYTPIIINESTIEIVTFGEVPEFLNFGDDIYQLTNTWTNSADESTGAAYQYITNNDELFRPFTP